MVRKLASLSVWVGLLAVMGCAQTEPKSAPEDVEVTAAVKIVDGLSVFTVNYPLAYFAERIGGDLVTVTFPAPANVDPAYWSPSPETVARYQQAELILLNGVDYAKWRQRATLPASKQVDTSRDLEDRRIPLEGGSVHSHGPAGEHSHQGYAFTTWLDPQLAIEQARAVAVALGQAAPEHESTFQISLESLVADLQGLDSDLESTTRILGDRPLLFSHPIYQYLIARYGLNARSVHWEPNQEPSEEQWQELQSVVGDHAANWMIWEGQPSAATVGRLEELGIQSTVYAPCANKPSEGDLLSVMHLNAAALRGISAQK